jgi:hypothetical protein
MLSIILLSAISCSAVHAGGAAAEPQTPNCPYHQQDQQQDDAKQAPPHCQDCIQTHFVKESHNSFDANLLAVPSSLASVILLTPNANLAVEPAQSS